MSRKQRIIVSVTGIFLVLLILVGLTYAYFLTKIKGNENNKSISVTTANLLLEYADVNDELITDSAVEPGKTWTKTFVATNKGNKTVTYGVALENVVNTLERKEDLVYTLECKQYSKTGFSIDKTNKTVTGTISGTCNGVSEETTFPSIGTILVQNDIADDKAQVYTLVVTYKETNTDQSVDMNKTFSAKANIVDPNTFGAFGSGTLASAIYKSATTATGDRTVYRAEPLSKVGEMSEYNTGDKTNETMYLDSNLWDIRDFRIGDTESVASTSGSSISSYTEAVNKYIYHVYAKWTKKVIKYDSATKIMTFDNLVDEYLPEKTFSKTQDDYGDSYYFRGNVVDNFVEFAEMCWRIVRIEGDGSIKLILASELSCSDANVTATSGYATDGAVGVKGNFLASTYGYKKIGSKYAEDYVNSASTTNNARTKLISWLERKILNKNEKALLKKEDWCVGDRTTAYDLDTYALKTETADELIKAEIPFRYNTGKRLSKDNNITLKCDGKKENEGEIDTNTIGLLNVDEAIFAGASLSGNLTTNDKYYLNNNAKSDNWWILSLIYFYDTTYVNPISGEGYFYGNPSVEFDNVYLRPVISLMSGTEISGGDGTVNNAYVVKTS